MRDQINFHLLIKCKNLLESKAQNYSFHINVTFGMGGELDIERGNRKSITVKPLTVHRSFVAYHRLPGDGHPNTNQIKRKNNKHRYV